MALVASRIEIWTAGLVNRLRQSPVLTVIAALMALALRSNRNVRCNRGRVIASVIPFLSLVIAAQESPQSAPIASTFEMVTIKPSKPDAQGNTFRVSGHRFESRNTSLMDLISFAYGLHAKQITNAPAWVAVDKYDLTALSDADSQSSETLWRGMLQKYLVEYFKVSFHRDTLELPLYVLTSNRTGPKLTRSKGDSNWLPALNVTLGSTNAANANVAAINATNANMVDLARVMQRIVLDCPVLDQTGIVGKYDFALNWTPDGSQFGDARAKIPTPTDTRNAPPDLFTAVQEQIGLKLEVVSAPSEVLVIDHVEKPDN
jgi:bla regulator protein blaR1